MLIASWVFSLFLAIIIKPQGGGSFCTLLRTGFRSFSWDELLVNGISESHSMKLFEALHASYPNCLLEGFCHLTGLPAVRERSHASRTGCSASFSFWSVLLMGPECSLSVLICMAFIMTSSTFATEVAF